MRSAVNRKLWPVLCVLALLFIEAGCVRDQERPGNSATSNPGTANQNVSPSRNAQPEVANASPSDDAKNDNQSQPNANVVEERAKLDPARQSQAQQTWFVVGISGDWFLAARQAQRLTVGTRLPAGSEIRIRLPYTGEDYISLVNHNSFLQRECKRSGICDRGYKLPGTKHPESWWERMAGAVAERWQQHPDKYVNPMSRGSALQETVLLLREGAVDLSPAIRRVASGRHSLQMQIIEDGSSGADQPPPPPPLEFKWDARLPSPVYARMLNPGLYALYLDNNSDERLSAADADAWVLVSPPDKYQKDLSQFRTAEALANKWGSDVGADVGPRFLRAYLEHLSTTPAK